MLMGSNTYRVMSEIVATGDDPTFPRMGELPKVVFSKSLHPPMSWVNTTLISDDLEVAIPAMKAEPGPPMRTIGSLSLGGSLLRLGLADRLRVMLFPQVLGETGQEPILEGRYQPAAGDDARARWQARAAGISARNQPLMRPSPGGSQTGRPFLAN